ncbi:transposase [Nonomuraea sp. JJY05]|uniref:transposase n=1 Tax=Nonomuraea sp. JJY05 TaxID=3350255 RepID=UPI00373E9F7D
MGIEEESAGISGSAPRLLPVPRRPGGPSQWSKRQLIDGIRWRLRVGAPWRDVPSASGPGGRCTGCSSRITTAGWRPVFAGCWFRGC